jgi:FkbM family methyltransferase
MPELSRFTPWRGTVPGGTQANWLGVQTAVDYADWSPHPEGELVEPPLPSIDTDEYPEWIDLLDAVMGAGERFAMAELGAGWGRWTTNAAFAYRQLHPGGELCLVAVEAEPTHYRWLREHLERNGVEAVAIHAAVAGAPGRLMLDRGDPVAWYGQAVKRSASWRDRLRRPAGLQPVRAITLAQALAYIEGPVDLIDLDVQGAEADVLEAGVEELARVRCVHVETHAPAIDVRLRALFGRLGWDCRVDIDWQPRVTVPETPWGGRNVLFDGGVQSWLNPSWPG